MTAPALLEVEGLKKHFPIRTGLLQRVTGQVHALSASPAAGSRRPARRSSS